MSESTQPVSAAEVERTINEHADAFEQERLRRAKRLEEARASSQRRMTRALLFGFIFMVGAFLFLAWRTETNTNLLRQQAHVTDQRFYEACTLRVGRQVVANEGREQFIQQIVAAAVPPRTEDERRALVLQLRDALLLPVEVCGDPPPVAD